MPTGTFSVTVKNKPETDLKKPKKNDTEVL